MFFFKKYYICQKLSKNGHMAILNWTKLKQSKPKMSDAVEKNYLLYCRPCGVGIHKIPSPAGVNFINILRVHFCTKASSKPNSKQRKNFRTKNTPLKCWWNWQQDALASSGINSWNLEFGMWTWFETDAKVVGLNPVLSCSIQFFFEVENVIAIAFLESEQCQDDKCLRTFYSGSSTLTWTAYYYVLFEGRPFHLLLNAILWAPNFNVYFSSYILFGNNLCHKKVNTKIFFRIFYYGGS
jgi:hypothetical protein